MITTRRRIFPIAIAGGAAVASVFAALRVGRRAKLREQQTAELYGWEDACGRPAASDVARP
jgi:hypothetical protein